MTRVLKTLFLLFTLSTIVTAGDELASLEALTSTQLEQRLTSIDTELSQLADWGVRSGAGSNGHRSATYPDPNHSEWFQIQLEQESRIDQVVLVPHLTQDSQQALRSDGFPVELHILAGNDQDRTGVQIAHFRATYPTQEHIAPLIFDLTGIKASWVRVVATELSARAWDGQYNLHLAEILVFRGTENIALRMPVMSSSRSSGYDTSKQGRFLVDGFMPYCMLTQGGKPNQSYLRYDLGKNIQPTLTIDLEHAHPLDRIHIHPLELSNNIPLNNHSDFAFPRHIKIEGANQSDFSDSQILQELKIDNIYDIGPIIMRRFPETACRYLRIVVIEPYIDNLAEPPTTSLGFAEIEVFSRGANVALGKSVRANFRIYEENRKLAALTDGQNFYGEIIPLHRWMEQLARRQFLERQRPKVVDELNQRYAQQKQSLRQMSWIVAILVTALIVSILITRIVRLRQINNIRQRFAADLHDHLGASLHTIGLLGDVALASVDSPERLNTTLTRSREITQRTSNAVRHCTDIQNAQGFTEHLKAAMQRTTNSILTDIEYNFTFTGDAYFQSLRPRLKMDLFLFLKESLINIVRHSEATRVSIQIAGTPQQITVTISDDGSGLPEDLQGSIPPSLDRRARLLRGKVQISQSDEWKTIVQLTRKQNRLLFWK